MALTIYYTAFHPAYFTRSCEKGPGNGRFSQIVRAFREFRSKRKKRTTSGACPQFPKRFSGKLPFHLTSNRNFRIFWLNGKHPFYHLYADDTQLYSALKSVDVDATKSRVENCISAFCRWMDLNELKLNHDKTEVMLIHSKYRPSPSFQSLCVGDESVAASQSARSLGVIFDEYMTFYAHVSSICRSSFYHLRNLSRIRKYLTKESAAVVVHAFVTSKIDYCLYCNALLYGLPKYYVSCSNFPAANLRKIVSKLFCRTGMLATQAKNTAARVVVLQMSRFRHITPVLCELHWVPIRSIPYYFEDSAFSV